MYLFWCTGFRDLWWIWVIHRSQKSLYPTEERVNATKALHRTCTSQESVPKPILASVTETKPACSLRTTSEYSFFHCSSLELKQGMKIRKITNILLARDQGVHDCWLLLNSLRYQVCLACLHSLSEYSSITFHWQQFLWKWNAAVLSVENYID